jgi:hypothetical protein
LVACDAGESCKGQSPYTEAIKLANKSEEGEINLEEFIFLEKSRIHFSREEGDGEEDLLDHNLDQNSAARWHKVCSSDTTSPPETTEKERRGAETEGTER